MAGRTSLATLPEQAAPLARTPGNSAGETVRPVTPTDPSQISSRISLPRLADLLLPYIREGRSPSAAASTAQAGQSRGIPANGAQGPTSNPTEWNAPRESSMDELISREPKGPLRSFADIPTELTREIQKAREDIAKQGGGLEAMRAMMQELSTQDAPSMSFTV
jgi:hypothetical protein